MKKIYYTQTTIILLWITGLLFSTLAAQVTIGSNLNPGSLSLLDLKEKGPDADNANSNRGLALPRVNLTDLNNLYPMFAGDAAYENNTGNKKTTEDAIHTGLVVYNLNKCDGFGPGTYVWVGQEWQPLAKVNIVQKPDISITTGLVTKRIDDKTILVHIPSGRDLRTFPSNNQFGFGLDWSDPANGQMNIADIAFLGTANGADGGLIFLNSTDPVLGTSYTSSPVALNYEIEDMSSLIPSDNANVDNPFRSRETTLTFEVPANTCYGSDQIKVRLNQTNYRLTFKRDNPMLNEAGYRLRDKSDKFPSTKVHYYRFLMMPNYTGSNISHFKEESNARWNVAYDEKTTGIITSDMIGPGAVFTSSTGGEERTDGTTLEITRKPEYISSNTAPNRHKTAGILSYTDTAAVARYYPIEVHFVQCVSRGFDHDGITDVGYQPDGSSWNDTDVLKHEDQDGNPFYSATFGSAGRWMITNLAATTYDEGSGAALEGTTIPVYETIDLQEHESGKKKFAYPFPAPNLHPTTNVANAGFSDWETVDWGNKHPDWRPEEGVFYNWYAATGRSYDDNALVQEGASGASEPTIVQGICPKGWYIPSDREWNQLEQEIYNNIDKYGLYDAADVDLWSTNKQPWDSSWDTSRGSRGAPLLSNHIGHGGAMKDICPPTTTYDTASSLSSYSYMQGSRGYSKDYNQNGFNATAVGRIKASSDNGTTQQRWMIQLSRAYNVNYWTRSQNSNRDAWLRDFNVANGGVSRSSYVKTHLMSVRCKKMP